MLARSLTSVTCRRRAIFASAVIALLALAHSAAASDIDTRQARPSGSAVPGVKELSDQAQAII